MKTIHNTQPTELDKAIELADKFARRIDRPLHQFSESTQDELVEIANEAFSAAAKRLKEVEKERDETKKMYERLRESVNGMTPCDLERLAYFEKHFFPMEQELTQLRADYRQALRASNAMFETLVAQANNREIPAGDYSTLIGNLQQSLSTPLAIATMKGEV